MVIIDKYERCVLKVKSRLPKSCEKKKWKGKGCYNPWAICTRTVGRPKKSRKSVKKSKRKSRKPRKSVKKSTRKSRKPRKSVKKSKRKSRKPRKSVKKSTRKSRKPRKSVKKSRKSVRSTRQIMNDLIKAIKNDDKSEIKKLRKEYSKAGYIISDNDLKRLIKKHSKSRK
jgi:hypothetical protein